MKYLKTHSKDAHTASFLLEYTTSNTVLNLQMMYNIYSCLWIKQNKNNLYLSWNDVIPKFEK